MNSNDLIVFIEIYLKIYVLMNLVLVGIYYYIFSQKIIYIIIFISALVYSLIRYKRIKKSKKIISIPEKEKSYPVKENDLDMCNRIYLEYQEERKNEKRKILYRFFNKKGWFLFPEKFAANALSKEDIKYLSENFIYVDKSNSSFIYWFVKLEKSFKTLLFSFI